MVLLVAPTASHLNETSVMVGSRVGGDIIDDSSALRQSLSPGEGGRGMGLHEPV